MPKKRLERRRFYRAATRAAARREAAAAEQPKAETYAEAVRRRSASGDGQR
jgi:hypothetical protein